MDLETVKDPQVLKMLRFDHKRMRDLLFQYEQSEVGSHKLSFAETALNELIIHSDLEEKIFYPRAAHVSPQCAFIVGELSQEHNLIDQLIDKLPSKEVYSAEFERVFSLIRERLEQHMLHEERNLFAILQSFDDIDDIASEMIELRDGLIMQESANKRMFTPQTLLFHRTHVPDGSAQASHAPSELNP